VDSAFGSAGLLRRPGQLCLRTQDYAPCRQNSRVHVWSFPGDPRYQDFLRLGETMIIIGIILALLGYLLMRKGDNFLLVLFGGILLMVGVTIGIVELTLEPTP